VPDLEANRAVVRAFCEHYTNAAWDSVADLLADDFRWQVPTSQRRQSAVLADVPLFNESPGRTKAETIQVFKDTQANVVDGRFDLTPVAFTAEGDRVAFEATSYAVNKYNDRIYDNRYHHLMVVRDGKIHLLREYQDTLLIFDVWMAP
jgi:ketosteroid isomerase-like protein